MSTLTVSLTHNGITYAAEVARIESTHLGSEDHGIFTGVLHFTGINGRWGQSNPARRFDAYDKTQDRRVGTAFGARWFITDDPRGLAAALIAAADAADGECWRCARESGGKCQRHADATVGSYDSGGAF